MYKLLGILLVIFLLVPGCAAVRPLALTVYFPKDGATYTASPVRVWGYVSSNEATVQVNDVIAPVSENFYSVNYELAEGENVIKIVATLGEKTVTNTVTVFYTPSE
jgi:hypothetical protein